MNLVYILFLFLVNSNSAIGGGEEGLTLDESFEYELNDPSPSWIFSKKPELVRLKRSEDDGDDDQVVGITKNNDSSWISPSIRNRQEVIDVLGGKFFNNVDISEEEFNHTLESHKYHVNKTYDHHKYYKSQIYYNDDFWVDLNALNESHNGIVKEHSMLSKSYRHAATIALSFKFPFYGHFVQNITIATGGFLYTGDYVHSWLAATQYIAPLMANFDNSQHENSKIRFADNGTALIVEWNDVYLKETGNETKTGNKTETGSETEAGPFTFQVIVHDNGDIVFAYKTVPIFISSIEDNVHPVKVGLSDAYIIDRTIFFVRQKTIYEYHRVNLKNALIANSSAIYFQSLPTCNIQQGCQKCLSPFSGRNDGQSSDPVEFECHWCPALNRCSDGLDRYRQSWLKHKCDRFYLEEPSQCHDLNDKVVPTTKEHENKESASVNDHHLPSSNNDYDHHYHHQDHEDTASNNGDDKNDDDHAVEEKRVGTSSTTVHANIAGVVVALLIISLIFAWIGYAYFNPHTWSGQLLIKYRPNRWHWRMGEPRYTAASIHM